MFIDNLEKLHQSMHWISDGNYKYRPVGMQQMYSIHGFVESASGKKEAKTLVVAIMDSGSREMFERLFGSVSYCLYDLNLLLKNYLFSVLHDQLIDRFGTIGRIGEGGRAHFDFEPAAIRAFESHFGPNLINMCLFHFTNCVNKKLQDLGLSQAYKQCKHVNRFIF
jgi:hypothetical protein